MTALLDTLRATVQTYGMLQPAERVLAAVSGGPDSICLLHVLRELGYPVEAAHLDHGTRGGESAKDAAFVKGACQALDVPFHLEARDIVREAEGSGRSFEEYAREARYEFLTRVAVQRNITVIATGHHADDQAETVLMRILRGTTSRGLGGILPVRHEEKVRIIRPLVDCTRQHILDCLVERGLAYCTDATNADSRFLRNKIRHELLPLLRREFNPEVDAALLRLSAVQRREDDLLQKQAEAFLKECLTAEGHIRRRAFAAGHPALQSRALVLLGWRHGVDCSYAQAEAARHSVLHAPTGSTCELAGRLRLRNSREITEALGAARGADEREIPLAVPGETPAFAKRFHVRYRIVLPKDSLKRYCTPCRQVFDADALGTSLTVRCRRPGDRFTPFGMTGAKKLKDYLIDMKMPFSERNTRVLLLGDGRIAWVLGHAISAHAAVTHNTRRIIEIEVMDAPE